jgi:hypothetical protein
MVGCSGGPDSERLRTQNPSKHLAALTGSNIELPSSQAGRRPLAEFELSEATMMAFIQSVDAAAQGPARLDFAAFVAGDFELPEDARITEKKEDVLRRGIKWFKEHKGKIAEKLFDKVNRLIEHAISGLGDSGDED